MHPSLAPDAAAALRAAAARGRPSVHLLPVDQGRRYFSQESTPTTAVPHVERVEDIQVRADLAARLYRPAGARLPVGLFLHGGGWVVGDVDTHDLLCRTLAVESGCAVLSVDYRRAPEHPFPAAVDDAAAALSWIRAHGAARGLDPARVAVAGDSAGGNLAIALALRARDDTPRLSFQLLFYPVTTTDLDLGVDAEFEGLVLSREELAWHQELYLPVAADRRSSEASPLDQADLAGLPQTLVIAAECDPIAPQSSLFVAELRGAGVTAALRTFPGTVHGFVQRPDQFAAARAALAEAGRSLAEALQPPRAALAGS